MKKTLLVALTMLMPFTAMASRPVGITKNTASYQPALNIPAQFSITGETTTLEWGCPVEGETIMGDNRKAVLKELISQCLQQVTMAAEAKPEVAAVIHASVISPNLDIQETSKGVHYANGTIFLETVVLKSSR